MTLRIFLIFTFVDSQEIFVHLPALLMGKQRMHLCRHISCSIAMLLLSFTPLLGQSGVDSMLYKTISKSGDSAQIAMLLNVAEFYSSDQRTIHLCDGYLKEAEDIAVKSQLPLLLGHTLNKIGTFYRSCSQLGKSRFYHSRALECAKEINDSMLMVLAYNGLGVVYRRVDNYALAVENHMAALRLAERLGHNHSVSVACNSLGNILSANGSYDEAIGYFRRGLELSRAENNRLGEAINLNNIGECFELMGEKDRAADLYAQSLQANRDINNRQGISINYTCLGRLALNEGNVSAAYEYFMSAYDINKQLPDIHYTATGYVSLAQVNFAMGRIDEARRFAQKAITLADSIGSVIHCQQAYEILSDCALKNGQYREAYGYTHEASRYRDSMLNIRSVQALATLRSFYETEKQEQELAILRQEQYIYTKQSQEMRLRLIALLAIVCLLIVISIWIARLYVSNKERGKFIAKQLEEAELTNVMLSAQKAEITSQKDDIIAQKETIAKQNANLRSAYHTIELYVQNITDSLQYAERMQRSMLPSMDFVRSTFADTMLVNKPKDIVSGDFFFLSPTTNGHLLFAVADCTGHGVPGAFMSIIGMNLLNAAVQRNMYQPAQVLTFLHQELSKSLSRSEHDSILFDSMDIAVCCYDPTTHELSYAGALISAFIVSDGVGTVLKHNTFSLGSNIRNTPVTFRSEHITLKPGDWIYLSSDGFADQIGGNKMRKYHRTNFNQLLERVSALGGEQQQQTLVNEFNQWRDGRSQIDDVLVWGIKI